MRPSLRFLTLAVAAVEGHGGWVNKFLGDGLMALFGAPRPCAAHADRAVAAARDLMKRLERLNEELKAAGQAPLAVGVGIGWLLDRWLGTRPIFLGVFVLVGGAAGVLNVWRIFAPRD